ncbi:hypothetical protein QKT49_gp077 [Acanthamoeba castellanii medusavirus]|uniref:Uncharacterized protein n=1 Tax=Acanthamoeba castellanii medusavirus J1 TaxID=3114988 RepID=A0A3T1CWK5_9VIRU|nr:hypothetical protein QKT49_gp077 [Acanthamoeba castellanii medusavirus]BBI30217.1 hypothetical protein [Acanthamoeba castellanii medusavirus J1]
MKAGRPGKQAVVDFYRNLRKERQQAKLDKRKPKPTPPSPPPPPPLPPPLPLHTVLGGGRIAIKFGVSFVQITFDHDTDNEDEDEDDRWDYDVHGSRDLDWSKLSKADIACLEKAAISLIEWQFDRLNPVFRDYTGSEVTLECDEIGADDIAERAEALEYLSFDKGQELDLPDFRDSVDVRAWVMV